MNFNFSNINLFRLSLAVSLVLLVAAVFYSCDKVVSVSPPDKPPPKGYIFIASYPKGFHIYLEGKARRRATPDSITWLKTNTYSVTLKKDLFRDTSFSVDVVEGEKHSVFVDFSKNPAMLGSISCVTNPAGSDIFLNDSATGLKTPTVISGLLPGYYNIRYHAQNHRDDSSLVTVRSSNQSIAKLTLVDTTIWKDYTTRTSLIPSDNLTCLTVDQNNVMWIGTDGQGLIKFDGNQWKLYNTLNSELKDLHINCISIDNNGVKWIGTDGGLVQMIGEYMFVFNQRTSDLNDTHIEAITFDDIGNTWVGTKYSGLYKTYIDRHDGVRYWVISDSASGDMPENWITTLVAQGGRVIWVGLKKSGIASNSGIGWSYYTRFKSGLPTDNIGASAVDDKGTVWFGHNSGNLNAGGLTYFDGTAFQTVYILPAFNSVYSLFMDRNNVKWIGTEKGVYKVAGQTASDIFNYDNTGLDLSNVRGIYQDKNGFIWFATNGGGLIKYKIVQ